MVLEVNGPGVNCPMVNDPGGEWSRRSMVRGWIVLGMNGMVLGVNCPGVN